MRGGGGRNVDLPEGVEVNSLNVSLSVFGGHSSATVRTVLLLWMFLLWLMLLRVLLYFKGFCCCCGWYCCSGWCCVVMMLLWIPTTQHYFKTDYNSTFNNRQLFGLFPYRIAALSRKWSPAPFTGKRHETFNFPHLIYISYVEKTTLENQTKYK